LVQMFPATYAVTNGGLLSWRSVNNSNQVQCLKKYVNEEQFTATC